MSSVKDIAFTLGQRVALTMSEDTIAVVDSILYNFDGMQYRVHFWDDKVRRTEWVFPHEIRSLEKVRA